MKLLKTCHNRYSSRRLIIKKMMLIVFFLFLCQFADSQDACNSVYCGSGTCIPTEYPTLPYYCQCQNGSNTILPCPSEDPCLQNPCGQGTCEVAPKSFHGYLCRCGDDTVSLTNCNVIRDTCTSNPCLNGLCIEGLTSFICNCLPTWTGRYCEKKMDFSCSDNLCGLGKCFQINDPSFPYVCLCPNGEFAGSCQITTTIVIPLQMVTTVSSALNYCNPLQDDDCMNGGECLPTTNGYRCHCTTGFTGHFCETRIDSCASYPCLYGGICYNLQTSYVCACADGSFRSQCLPIVTAVSPSTVDTGVCPCRNGGVCAEIGSQTCTCPNGVTGQFCENLLYNSCRDIACHNGGTCYVNSGDSSALAYCQCKNGYTGQFCEIEYFRCPANGRFTDQYNCANGKYFECIYFDQDEPNVEGRLLSRNCPSILRFNVLTDQCDYPQNVLCT